MSEKTNQDASRVLAFGAHPDDVEISCAGTLRALQGAGCAVYVATMTLGDCGSRELPPDEVRRVRRAEAEAACRILGAGYHYGGSNDFRIFNDDPHNGRTTLVMRLVAPQIVLTHSPGDYMLDHDATSVLVRNACFYASAPNYDSAGHTGAKAMDAVPHLFYWDVMEGFDMFGKPVAPEFYVDISDVIDLKTEMLAAHKSQREWLRAQHGIDEYLDSMRAWSARRGEDASRIAGRKIAYAEAFRQHRGHAYPQNNVIEETLSDRVIRNPRY